MEAMGAQLHAALVRFDHDGRFGEADYQLLRGALSRVAGPRASPDLLDGLVNLFFERHWMNDVRRAELLALDEVELLRVTRHRFRQVVADERPDLRAYHALRAHVRDALEGIAAQEAGSGADAGWPLTLRTKDHYQRRAVEQAVRALCCELRVRPSPAVATSELLRRYAPAETVEVTEAHQVPEVIRRRLDGQKLAANILELLLAPERDLLRHVLDEGTVEEWAEGAGRSRASAYRLMARLKSLCKLEFAQRSNGTQLEALQALRGRLGAG